MHPLYYDISAPRVTKHWRQMMSGTMSKNKGKPHPELLKHLKIYDNCQQLTMAELRDYLKSIAASGIADCIDGMWAEEEVPWETDHLWIAVDRWNPEECEGRIFCEPLQFGNLPRLWTYKNYEQVCININDVRFAIQQYHGCQLYNGKCLPCELDRGGCNPEGVESKFFDKDCSDILESIEAEEFLNDEEWEERNHI
jgi:hypothetical protein